MLNMQIMAILTKEIIRFFSLFKIVVVTAKKKVCNSSFILSQIELRLNCICRTIISSTYPSLFVCEMFQFIQFMQINLID